MTDNILNVHTPTASLAVPFSFTEGLLQDLFGLLTRKVCNQYRGARVGPGWLKYLWSDSVWNLDDDADYTIMTKRWASDPTSTPTLYLHNPTEPLPLPPSYFNPSYYALQPSRFRTPSPSWSAKSTIRTRKSKGAQEQDNEILKFKKQFHKFHAENGVRTVIGSIGPIKNVRMLLKSGHRHVYLSRSFAVRHHFVPADASPGHYGYGGLVNVGKWPITLQTAPNTGDTEFPRNPHIPIESNDSFTPSSSKRELKEKKKEEGTPVFTTVYLSEEPHFDVVLGRSFFEARQLSLNPVDPTDVWCGDTGEKLFCELVILRDGKGDIISVT